MKKGTDIDIIKKFLEVKENEQCKLITINPEMARFLLKYNTNNRPISYKRTNIYADIMNKNEWILTNDMITFNPAGVLTNGQHRLYAIEKSNKSFDFFIAFNIENSMGMDNGKSRTLSDNLLLFDSCHEILRRNKLVHRVLRTTLFINTGTYTASYIPPNYIVSILNKYEKELIDLVNSGVLSRQWRSRTSQCVILSSLLLAYLNGVSLDDLANIKEVLDTGIAKNEYDYPIIGLRDKLYTFIGSGRTVETLRATATQYCINSVVKHDTTKKCRTGSFYYTYNFD